MKHTISAAELAIGDVIAERYGIRVQKIEHNKCGAGKVHINGDACYESFSDVDILVN